MQAGSDFHIGISAEEAYTRWMEDTKRRETDNELLKTENEAVGAAWPTDKEATPWESRESIVIDGGLNTGFYTTLTAGAQQCTCFMFACTRMHACVYW